MTRRGPPPPHKTWVADIETPRARGDEHFAPHQQHEPPCRPPRGLRAAIAVRTAAETRIPTATAAGVAAPGSPQADEASAARNSQGQPVRAGLGHVVAGVPSRYGARSGPAPVKPRCRGAQIRARARERTSATSRSAAASSSAASDSAARRTRAAASARSSSARARARPTIESAAGNPGIRPRALPTGQPPIQVAGPGAPLSRRSGPSLTAVPVRRRPDTHSGAVRRG